MTLEDDNTATISKTRISTTLHHTTPPPKERNAPAIARFGAGQKSTVDFQHSGWLLTKKSTFMNLKNLKDLKDLDRAFAVKVSSTI